MNNGSKKHSVLWITTTALFLGMNIALSSFGVPVPGGHFYLNDVVICTAAILLDPLAAFIVGGIGSFLGDFFFYPTPMFVSLAVHGLQAVVISLMVHTYTGEHPRRNAICAVSIGAVIMVVGYTLGRAFIYSTPAYAIAKLPFQILQAVIGAVSSILLCYSTDLGKIFEHEIASKY